MKKSFLFALETCIVFAVCLGVYLLSASPTHSGDTIPNTLFGFNLLENHVFDFDNFRGSYLDTSSGYWFHESASGHLNSVYPLGTAVVIFPITFFYWLFLHFTHAVLSITSESFDSIRIFYEQFVASFITALSASLFYLASRCIFRRATALTTTVVFAFATSSWAISSQALWQQSAANLCITTAILCVTNLVSYRHSKYFIVFLLATAGLTCGLLPAVRPVDGLFSVAIIIFCAIRFKKNALWLTSGLIPLLAAVAYNVVYFHNLFGGYQSYLTAEVFSLSYVPTGILGCLFSPGRGLFIYSPVLIFSIFALSKMVKSSAHKNGIEKFFWMLSLASFGCCALYFGYKIWWGGACYGPRLMTEAVPMLAFLLNYYLEPTQLGGISKPRNLVVLFYFLTALSAVIQGAGVLARDGGSLWNAIPLNVDKYPQRLWDWEDSPITRSFHAVSQRSFIRRLRLSGKPAITNARMKLQGQILGANYTTQRKLERISANSGITEVLNIGVQNLNSLTWTGYKSASTAIETFMYVKVSFYDKNNRLLEKCGGELPLAETIGEKQRSFAVGEIQFPRPAGQYRMHCHLHCFYVPEDMNETKDFEIPVTILKH